MKKRTDSIIDGLGTPSWLPQVERWLVGGAMLAETVDVQTAAATVSPEDFRDDTLGLIWSVMPYLECTGFGFVAQALGDRIDEVGGEPRLVELAFAQGAYLYQSPVFLEAHAVMVHEYAEKRRKLQALSQEAAAIFEGRPSNVISIARAQGVRPFIAS